ncbi:cell growth regulator with RING finger domain protein 1-like isoform X1 [Ischnura elegans]|uniref:cell growth regulator with RING finger domain protein 1-like isoform X1 n=1 Tax=Ischnura elegans TaxID=197161 RepID=UPI001ED87FA6|nr:cell growth regulator with RING finger domain protein 1-like isoform X1 [Ischnura elegans]
MIVAMTAMLVSVAELSNMFSFLAVVVCFCGMVIFVIRNMMVFRFHGDEIMFGGSVHPIQPQIPQMKMMRVHIPFTFKLQESSKSCYTEYMGRNQPFNQEAANGGPRKHLLYPRGQPAGSQYSRLQLTLGDHHEPALFDLQCTVSSQVPYTLQAYWGVSIRELHLFLWRPWSAMRSAVQQGLLLHGHHQQKGAVFLKQPHGDELFTLFLPRPSDLDLGTPPRLCYPLVIFLVRNDQPTLDLHPDETVALINVVHIKDSVCTLPTSILAQYLKQANGQLSCLKQLYLATGNPLTYDDEQAAKLSAECEAMTVPPGSESTLSVSPQPISNSNSSWSSPSSPVHAVVEQLCVVCQYFPLSRALLPCRHTCVCASCFAKLDRCPMCRGPIRSYFCIRGEEYMPGADGSGSGGGSQASKPPALYNWLMHWNDRLIEFLGFH